MGLIDDLKLQYKVGDITQKLIFWNIGLFVVPLIIFSILKLGGVHLPLFDWTIGGTENLFSLSSRFTDLLWKPWTLITYAFLHAGFFHILFNMLWLYFAGRVFTTFFTQKQLFGLYIVSAIFAGLIFILAYNFLPIVRGVIAPMVGASASIMAILVATAVYSPYYQVRLPLIGSINLWYIAAFFIVMDLIYASVENTGGHIAHLSGALFGYLFIVMIRRGFDVTKRVSNTIIFFENIFKPKEKTPFKKVHRNKTNAAAYKAKNVKPNSKDITQQKIDDILDKISKSGYDSLTKEEKEFLFKVGK